MTRETSLALAMLRESPNYVEDARQGAPVGNSVVGGLLAIQHGIPRQYAEAGVAHALAILDQEKERPLTLELSREEVEELIRGLGCSAHEGQELDEDLAVALSKRLEALLE